MKKLFCEKHRGMSGSSICLNMLLITVRLPIYLNVSIAVSHVSSAAPLSGLPHRQSKNEFALYHLHVDFSTVKDKVRMNLISLTYSYEAYLRGLDTQYNVPQWLVEPADCSCCFGVPLAVDTVHISLGVRVRASPVFVCILLTYRCELLSVRSHFILLTHSALDSVVPNVKSPVTCRLSSLIVQISMWHSGTAQGRGE
ncbi:hypothetical protein T02_14932 [Trichinella nativa]|uniref:Uncharacterized protein n=1 Tax=Trichinella nativa TaxID=6335 RepID=A0A0V1KWN0_9BILA|nr:hypothetical protein T02_14932 [Trichinella nativa]